MGLVLLAVAPAMLYGIVLFGWPALNLFLVTDPGVACCAGGHLRGRARSATVLMDGSALLTGILLALSLPPWAPWWIGVVGGFFAIVVGKQVFGGISSEHPSIRRCWHGSLLVSFPVEMTFWLEPRPLFSSHAPGFMEGLAIPRLAIPTSRW